MLADFVPERIDEIFRYDSAAGRYVCAGHIERIAILPVDAETLSVLL